MSTATRGGMFGFGARPIGSAANRRAAACIAAEAEKAGCEVRQLPFTCPYWEKGPSAAGRGGARVEVFAGPFSPAFDASAAVAVATSLAELQVADCAGKILILHGEIAKSPLMPRDFPFYFPDEHKAVYEALDERKPAAVLAITGPHPSCGLNPFPLFDDANFRIPAAYVAATDGKKLLAAEGLLRLQINSWTTEAAGEQIVAVKKAKGASPGKIVVCAHMDTAYDTPGALDNAAGVDVLLRTLNLLQDYAGPYDLEFVPFNGEDSGLVKGQLAYLDEFGGEMGNIRLAVNIDSPGSRGSTVHVSAYNCDDDRQKWLDTQIAQHSRVGHGPEWVEGDHSIFAFQGVPALAVTSSDLRETVMKVSHTPKDVENLADPILLEEAAKFVAGLVAGS